MKVEPLLTYRKPKYPRREEGLPPHLLLAKNKSKALIAAMLAVSTSLSGCIVSFSGKPPSPDYLSEADIIQILQNEAAALGISFENGRDTTVRYSGLDIVLDLYNEEKQVGVAVVDRVQANELYRTDGWEEIYSSGLAAQGSLEDEKTLDFFLTSEYLEEYHAENLRQAFREFIEWLQSEGII
ncbi:MAG: hypothetical protein FWE85_06140 [Clostridiales bacterium]|nr:hypothetical protein [Clostridiales bacterium]